MANLDKFSTAPTPTYRAFLRQSAQDALKELPPEMASPSGALLPQVAPPSDSQSSLVPSGENPLTPHAPLGHQATILAKPTRVTQAFGNQNPGVEVFSKGINSGTDFAADPGTSVALPDGQWKILSAYSGDNTPGHIGDSTNSGYGNSVFAQNEKTGEKMRFSHLSQVDVNPGDEIQGGIIGQTGQTGNVTGPHLDLEYYDQNGQLQDVLKSIYGQYLDMGK